MRRLIVCDIDGVLVDGQTQKSLLLYLFRKGDLSFGLFCLVYFWFLLYKARLVTDVISIRCVAFRAFRGWPVIRVQQMFRDFFQAKVQAMIRSDIVEMLKTHVAQGDVVVFVTATLGGIAREIVSHLGFGEVIGTELEFVDGKCTGAILGDVPYGINKLKAAEAFAARKGLGWEGSLAVGDHISDAFLLERAQEAVVVQPDEPLRRLAVKKGWRIHAGA